MSPGPVPVSQAPNRAGRPSCRGCRWYLRLLPSRQSSGAGSAGAVATVPWVSTADCLAVATDESATLTAFGSAAAGAVATVALAATGSRHRCRGCTHGAVGDGRGLLDRCRGDAGRGRRRSADRGRTRRGCRRSRRNDALCGHRAGQDCSCRPGDVLACRCDRWSCSLCRRRGGRGGSRRNRGCDGRRDRGRDDSGEQCGECLRDARGRRVLPTLLLIGRRWLRARGGRGYFNGCGIDDCSPPLVVSWSCLRRPVVRRRTARRSSGSSRLEIFTTSPVWGAWMNLPPPR